MITYPPRTLFVFLFLFTLNPGSFCQRFENSADSLIRLFPEMEEKDRSTAFVEINITVMREDVEQALNFVNTIESYAVEAKDTVLLITANALRAEYHWRKSAYKIALEHAITSINLASSNIRFQAERAKGLQTAGTIHLYLYNTEEALDYYKQAIEIFKASDQLTSVASIYNNTGVIYMDAAETDDNPALLDSALWYYNRVFSLKDRARPHTLLSTLGNMASIYVLKEDWEKAEEINGEWEKLEAENPSIRAKSMNYGTVGLAYMGTNNLTKAERYLMEGLEYSVKLGSKYEMQEYHLNLADLMERKSDFEKALMHSKTGWALKDSIFNAEKVNTINELEAKYQNEKKEREIIEVNAKLDRKERFQTFLLTVIGVVVLFSLIAIFLLVQRFKLKRALLSQEIDTLRLQINSAMGGTIENLDITLDQFNEGLFNALSEREFEVLKLIHTQKSNKEMADELYVSINTIKTHLRNIYSKLGISNRTEAMEVLLAKS